MSELEKTEEVQNNAQEGLEFFKALKDFFEREPRTMILFLHVIAGKTEEVISLTGGLPNGAYKLMGQIRTIQELFWDEDRNEILLETISNPDTTLKLMMAIATLTKAYTMIIASDKVDASVLTSHLEDVVTTLYGILRAAMDHAEERACEDSDP